MRPLLLFALVLAVVAIETQFRTPALPLSSPCIEGDEANALCWENFYTDVAETEGSIIALRDLEIRVETTEAALQYCHDALHVIGKAAFREFGSVARAYEHGKSFCRAGYYHGVLEGAFGDEGGEKLLSTLDSICAAIPGKERYAYQYYSCVHGIGHGLMAYFDHDLFASLEGCDRLTGAWEQSSCYGGVFMQNISGDTPAAPSRFLKRDDLVYPCNAVADRYREECFSMQTSHMNRYLTFDEVFQVCETVEDRYQRTCFESAGRDISGFSKGDGNVVVAFCTGAKSSEARLGCYVGASIDYIQLQNGSERARKLCKEAQDNTAQSCLEAIEMHILQQ